MAGKLSRRSFLKAIGAAGAASATVPLLPSLSKSAEAGQFPKRLVTFFSANGTIRNEWTPQGSRTNFTFGKILQPLAPFKDKMIIPEGLDNVIGRRENGPGKGHPRGMGTVLTGRPLLEGDLGDFSNRRNTSGWAGGPSIDQVIANELDLGSKTPFKTLNLGVVSSSNQLSPHLTMTYADRDQPIFAEDDVYRVHDRLFADIESDPFDMEKLRVQRRSVLDVVKNEFNSVKRKVSAEDKARLEEHFESIRAVEQQLTTERTGANCEKPDMSGDRIDVSSRRNFPQLGRLQIDQLVTALKCDLTRVGTIQYHRSTSPILHRWLGHSGRDDKHHNLSHQSDGNSYAQRRLVEINNWYAKQFAYLVQKLDEVPEGDGTLLDNTVCVWVSEVGKGNSHTLDDLPIVMAGGCGGALETGQHLKFGNKYHQDLWVTIAQAMDVEMTSFGAPRTCNGAISELLA